MAHLDLRSATLSAAHPHPARRIYLRLGKRTLDLALALLLLPVLTPVIAVLWLLARRDGAPGLFAHVRVGRHGRAFTCYKIRTMVPEAERKLTDYLSANAEAAAQWERAQKLQDDPRVTRLGRFLRRTSLDELPQIWNVLRGDMSLVGPRPVTAPELGRYGLHAPVYLSLRPGVTGLWQVTARSTGCYAERLRLDQAYASQMGLWHDLALILRTALVVVRQTGR